jgi:PAS domain S-box-containing protein
MEPLSGLVISFGHQLGILAMVVVCLAALRRETAEVSGTADGLLSGLVFGVAAVLVMLDPVVLRPGVIFDARNTIIAVAGMLGGPVSAAVTVLLAAGYRVSLGGSGTVAALSGMLAAAVIAVVHAAWLRSHGHPVTLARLFLLACFVTAASLLSFTLLPAGIILVALENLALPIALTNLVGIPLLGIVLRGEQRRHELAASLAAALREQRAQAARLRRSEEQYRLLADNTGDMIERLDLGFRRLYVSPAVREMLGGDADRLLGTDMTELIHPDDRPALRRKLEALAAGQMDGVRNLHRLRRQGGDWIWAEAHFRLLRSAQGSPAEIVGVTRDVSDRMALEEQFRQAQKMEAIGQLTGGLAHDFNNILTVVLGNAETLALELKDPHQRELAEAIEVSAGRAAELTGKLLAFGRRRALRPEVHDLSAIVASMAPLLHRTLGRDVALTTDADGPAPAFADRTLLEAALLNLAINARDAMPGGGRLAIRTGRRIAAAGEGELRPGEPVVYVTVHDTGIGIPPDILGRVFEPFFTTKEVGKGSGLGLSMVHGFIAQSGGHVGIESEPGRGTTVSIVLRAADADARAPGVAGAAS